MKDSWLILRLRGAAVAGLVAMALGAALLVPRMRADDPGQAARAVRLSSVEGKVQVSQGDQILADPAVANMPLFEGTQVVTSDGGQAEIQFEDGSVARLSPNSSLTLSVLRGQDGTGESEIVLESGLGYFEVQASSAGQMRVRFADAVVTASGFTVVRINLDNPPGELAIFSGNAHVERGSAVALDLHGGQSVALNGTDPTRYNLSETIETDSWDAWNADRDQALQAEYGSQTGATKSFADSNNPAWADLDSNGNWYNVPGEGYIWSPTDASNPEWDPYGNGSWMFTPGFGYIWVSGASWGYLPYQCGSWNYFDAFGWGWAPGGMCNPWWGGGGWRYNIGYGPSGYRPPRRPRPGPVHPWPVKGGSSGNRSKILAQPVIPVSRRLSTASGALPARDRNVPVVIAGHAVKPDLPAAPRSAYQGPSSGFANRAQPVYSGGTRVQGGTSQPSGIVPSHPAYPAAPGAYGAGSQHPAAPSRPVAAPSQPSSGHPSGGGSSHPSGGSSAGGGSHPSGGGGGGGGGHSSGGGGGGHH
jgi:hypothetical protein